jgi:chlorite dismutase
MPCQSYIFFDVESSIHSILDAELRAHKTSFIECSKRHSLLQINAYATIGFKANNRFLLHIRAQEAAEIQKLVNELMHTKLGAHLKIVYTLFGLKHKSPYSPAGVHEKPEPDLSSSKYLIVYPFTKTHAWHQLPFEERRAMMKEHVGIGHTFNDRISQILLYGYGLDDHEFILSYATDDLRAFQSLVMELRNTKGRAFTEYDTPLFLATRASLEDALDTL